MPNFTIPLNVFASANVEIQAETIQEAIEIAQREIIENFEFGDKVTDLDIVDYSVNEELLKG